MVVVLLVALFLVSGSASACCPPRDEYVATHIETCPDAPFDATLRETLDATASATGVDVVPPAILEFEGAYAKFFYAVQDELPVEPRTLACAYHEGAWVGSAEGDSNGFLEVDGVASYFEVWAIPHGLHADGRPAFATRGVVYGDVFT